MAFRLHLVEILDLPWIPRSLELTVREMLLLVNSRPFRRYHERAADRIAGCALRSGCRHVVELGAGSAPLTRMLLKMPALHDVQFIVCDLRPEVGIYRRLEERHGGRLLGIVEPVDFSRDHVWPAETLLIVSAALHHLSPDARRRALLQLASGCKAMLICEPLNANARSFLIVLTLAIFPALLSPILHWARRGRLRRIFWTWLLPAAPMILIWDGLISVLRMWSAGEWAQILAGVDGKETRIAIGGSEQFIEIYDRCPESRPAGH